MPLDPNIILGFNQQPDALGTMSKMMSLKQMANQNSIQDQAIQQKQFMNDAIKSSVVDGKVDHKAVYAKLAQVDPTQAEAYKLDIQTKTRAQFEKDHEITGMVLSGATPDNWKAQRDQLVKLGVSDADKLPELMDQKQIEGLKAHLQTAKEQQSQSNNDRDYDFKVKKQAEDKAIEQQKLGISRGEKSAASNQKYADSFKKDMDPDSSRTGNFGKISQQVINAQKLEALTAQNPTGNLDSRQMEEYALGLANMLSGSSGAARSQVEALIPHTFWGKAQGAKEWLMNEPQGAEQQAFVKRMAETVAREKEIAQGQLNKIREQRLPFHKEWSKKDPEGYANGMRSYGLDPENYDQNGMKKPVPKDDKPSWAK